MIESFFNAEKISNRPYLMFFWSFFLCSVGFGLGNIVSSRLIIAGSLVNLSGLFSIIFIVIPSSYIFTSFLKKEEISEEKFISRKKYKDIWKMYYIDIVILLMFFFGAVFSFSFWSFFVPADFFEVQKAELGRITSGTAGYATASGLGFREILSNNLFVMILSFVFTLAFGSGIVFILIWNASLLGVRIAEISSGLNDVLIKSFPFLPHGIFEVTGFILAGISGGLLSASIMRGRHRGRVFEKIFLNSLILLTLALVFVIIGAWIEVN